MKAEWTWIPDIQRLSADPQNPDEPIRVLFQRLSEGTANAIHAEIEAVMIAEGVQDEINAELESAIRGFSDDLPPGHPLREAIDNVPGGSP